MAAEENGHRRRLIDLFVAKFGDHIPLVRRHDIQGYIPTKPVWQMRPLGIDTVRAHAREMERTAARFYRQALTRTTDASTRKLLGDLAEEEEKHDQIAAGLEEQILTTSARGAEAENERRRFVLQIIQPGLVGLMDGSVSTLAPVFAAAFATHNPWNAFLVGLAASIGAGISMGFAEALSDDGKLSGRGAPLLRGLVCGLMTTAGGIGHTLPFLIPYFYTATVIAFIVVIIELITIAWIQWRYMETPPLSAAAKVMIGGALVLAAGILIGSS
jgi:rubrerythrin